MYKHIKKLFFILFQLTLESYFEDLSIFQNNIIGYVTEGNR